MMTIESEYIYSIYPSIYHNDILNFNVFSKVSGLIEC